MSAVRTIIRRQRRNKRRSPARRPRWLVWLGVSGAVALVVAVAFAAWEFVHTPWLRVRSLSVRGAQRLTRADLSRVMSGALGEPLLLVDVDRLRSRLERSPGILEARVARRAPDTIEAVISERRAVAHVVVGGIRLLVDDNGMFFPAYRAQPGDSTLPVVRGVSTQLGEDRLRPEDRPAIEALVLLARALGGPPPEGTIVDLTPKDRIVLRAGHDAPVLWLDRNQPGRNLKNMVAWQGRLAESVPGGAVDLRFPNRLTLAPPPPADAARTE